jgi:Icc-related predicted phosphoesterase
LTKIFFTTDVHGSEICWKKFISAGKFYEADILILGGDITGKAIVPIVATGNNAYRSVLLEQESILNGEDEVKEMEKRVRSRGYYPYRTNPDEMSEFKTSPEKVSQVFVSLVLKTVQEWLDYASDKLNGTGIRCFITPGNDDMFELDEMVKTCKQVDMCEGHVVQIDDHHEMISSGWTNPTPWHTFREAPEEDLLVRLENMTSQVKNMHNCIFNLHAPPYGSGLDEAPELTKDLRPKLAGNLIIPVGSKAVRKTIETHQPLLGLHGHIHECKATARLGRTLCINPGSMYEQGYLSGALITLGKDKIKSFVLTNG